jgi:hypothetical protein
MASYKAENIETISDFVNIVEQIKHQSEQVGNFAELLFRGQNIDKPLLPKLGRLRLNGDIINVEKLMLSEFQRVKSFFMCKNMKGYAAHS